jgi:Ferritin-like domain
VPDGAAAGRVRATALTRRALLAASGAVVPVLLTGCKGVQVLGAPPPAAADVRVLRAAISAEELMVARYAAAVSDLDTSLPPSPARSDTASLRAVRAVQAEHAEHLVQLRSRLIEPSASSSSPGSSPSPAPSVQVTGTFSEILSQLEQAEQAASDRLLSQLGGLPGSLAQLFASIAASEATHVPYLRTAGSAR